MPLWSNIILFMFISENFDQFKNLFVTKLKNMLSADELGAFILVLANSQQDTYLKNELKADIEKTFIKLKNNFINGKLEATPDDIDVFEQIVDTDINEISAWQTKKIGDWEIVYNSMRKLRPARTSSQVLTSIKQDFDETKFHFNKPYLKPEILWEGDYESDGFEQTRMRVLYNKFPFSDYHLLIVPSPEKNSSQQLSEQFHHAITSLVKSYENIFPGFGVGFNSLAAGASVNHLHFQGFVRPNEFPIENKNWKHNGGEEKFPLAVKRFDSVEPSWLYIKKLLADDVAFNCIYRGDFFYLVARAYQGTVQLPDWLNGAGWLDVAGVMTVSDAETFDTLDEKSVSEALALLAFGVSQ